MRTYTPIRNRMNTTTTKTHEIKDPSAQATFGQRKWINIKTGVSVHSDHCPSLTMGLAKQILDIVFSDAATREDIARARSMALGVPGAQLRANMQVNGHNRGITPTPTNGNGNGNGNGSDHHHEGGGDDEDDKVQMIAEVTKGVVSQVLPFVMKQIEDAIARLRAELTGVPVSEPVAEAPVEAPVEPPVEQPVAPPVKVKRARKVKAEAAPTPEAPAAPAPAPEGKPANDLLARIRAKIEADRAKKQP